MNMPRYRYVALYKCIIIIIIIIIIINVVGDQ